MMALSAALSFVMRRLLRQAWTGEHRLCRGQPVHSAMPCDEVG
jgi:hypothetical protein